MKLTAAPTVAVLALGCLGSTPTEKHSGASTHSGSIVPPMPPPSHSAWVADTGGSEGHSGGHSGHSGTQTPPMPPPDTGGHSGGSGSAARTSPPPIVRPVP